jgi:hypothetical protein
MTEKLSPIERALVAAAAMPAHDARKVLMLICESGMTTKKDVPQPTQGEIHYAKREKIIKRMKSAADRILDYAKHETLRNCEKHFRDNPGIKSAESDDPTLAANLTFKKKQFSDELLAALREESAVALSVAGQQLFDEIGRDDPWTMPGKVATQFLNERANLLADTPDEIHAEVMQTIQDGLENSESRKELMSRIDTAMEGIKKSRAETIANTETAAAFNYAREKAMREAGVTHKKWLHSMSPLIKEPRPTHLEADGQIQPIDEPFDIGGVPMLRPGDESAGPEEIINCHCVAIPVEAP